LALLISLKLYIPLPSSSLKDETTVSSKIIPSPRHPTCISTLVENTAIAYTFCIVHYSTSRHVNPHYLSLLATFRVCDRNDASLAVVLPACVQGATLQKRSADEMSLSLSSRTTTMLKIPHLIPTTTTHPQTLRRRRLIAVNTI
jgi:hypothetical protein